MEVDKRGCVWRRGFDVLLDAGLSAADVASMRRQFYESRGEEVPEGMDLGDVSALRRLFTCDLSRRGRTG